MDRLTCYCLIRARLLPPACFRCQTNQRAFLHSAGLVFFGLVWFWGLFGNKQLIQELLAFTGPLFRLDKYLAGCGQRLMVPK